MAGPIFFMVPKVIEKCYWGMCYKCRNPAAEVLTAAVSQVHHNALRKHMTFEVIKNDIVLLGACSRHSIILSKFAEALRKNDYLFKV